MPALPAVPGVIRIAYKHSIQADTDVVNRVYYSYSGAEGTGAELATMAAALATEWNTNIAGQAATSVALIEIDIVDLSSPTAPTGTWSGSHAGTRSGQIPNAASCVLLNFKISRRYRGGKPRVYLPWGVAGDIASAQTWGSTFLTSCLTAWGEMQTAVSTNVWSGGGTTEQVNVSYYEGFTNYTGPTGRERARATVRTVPPPIPVDVINSVAAQTKIGSQRRRIAA